MSFLAALALSGLAAAQGEIKPFPKIDPYTKDAPDAKTKAGYASFGPFRFGDAPTTTQIEETLGGIPMIWVETDHFKLGSGLPEYTIPDDKREKERLKEELACPFSIRSSIWSLTAVRSVSRRSKRSSKTSSSLREASIPFS